MNASWRLRRSDRLTLILLLVLAIGAAAIFAAPHLPTLRRDGLTTTLTQLYEGALYNRVVIHVDYFHDGFVRRGLSGTLLALLPASPQQRTVWFVAGSLALLLVPLTLLARRLADAAPGIGSAYLIVTLMVSPQTFYAWSHDLVRTDVLVAGLLAWATLFAVLRHWGLAIATLVIGLLVHEAALVFGTGVVLAAMWLEVRRGGLPGSRALRLVAALVAATGLVALLQAIGSVDGAVLARRLIGDFPTAGRDAMNRDVAVYMAAGGLRALRTATCYNVSLDNGYASKCLFGAALVVAYVVIWPARRHPWVCGAAVLAPTFLLMAVANDVGRWFVLAVFCTWLLSAFIVIRQPDRTAPSTRSAAVGSVVVAALLTLGYTPYNDVNLIVGEFIAAHWPNDVGSLEEWLNRCDPAWRALVYGH